MRIGDPVVQLSVERFRLLRDMINERYGIFFGDDTRYLVQSRLGERLAHLSLPTFEDYYYYIRYSADGQTELEEAIDVLTTNETYFFREEYQLHSFSRQILPELARNLRGRRKLMIWSAGCSSGEEAYTIAVLVRDSGLFADWDVRIFGSDVSRRVLAKARRGVYRASSFRATSEAQLTRHFTKAGEGFAINDDIRSLCHFGHLNLLDEDRIALLGKVDVVFCRNVLIYFDKKSKLRTISSLYERLNPGGFLLLGHTESLLNLSTAFELVHLSDDLVYRKPEVLDAQ
ncbi:MAG: protein-glutamate O-methyltransferase CheR [Myxococcota bacterium]|nr:protein-glutamate O-methyltransferase CheR [Myxococcota bacterium]